MRARRAERYIKAIKGMGVVSVVGALTSFLWTIPEHDPMIMSGGIVLFGIGLIAAARMLKLDLIALDKKDKQ